MRFTVIEGGKSKASSGSIGDDVSPAQLSATSPSLLQGAVAPKPTDVRKEASKRLETLGINRLRNRQMATGQAMPREMHYLGLQIDFAAESLAKLDVIPEDYRSDCYWPSVTNGRAEHS